MRGGFLCIILFFTFQARIFSQALMAKAGPDFTLCAGSQTVLGASPVATGGTPPYIFSWSPSTALSSNGVANPTVTGTSSMKYALMVIDNTGARAYDTVYVFVPVFATYGAGEDTSYCNGLGTTLGHSSNFTAPGYTFSWTPSSYLDNASLPNPKASPPFTITYSLIITKNGCTSKSTVKVNIKPLDLALNTHDTIINEGETITLISNASGLSYSWTPPYMIRYENTSTADVSPLVNTTYTVYAVGTDGCVGFDTVRVRVEKSDELVFYSAFTPNGDGENDFFFIGNIAKYPDNVLKIYNRYGQVIFTSAGYNNDWNGSYQGNQIPTGTYFYILDTGTDKGKYKGTVTILR
jgi:gliding motility-associated-like protein